MKVSRLQLYVLASILLLAIGLRMFKFGSIPYGINRDEAAIGYTAYLLLNTGQDEHGQRWPWRFESFGDWKQPVYIYLTIPLVGLFGLSPQVVRLPSLLFGLLMIISAFFITNRLSSQRSYKWAGVLAASLIALNPWHFHFSHLALEAMVAAALFSIGVLLTDMESARRNVLGVVLLLLAMMTYHAALIVIPLWLIGYIIINRKRNFSKAFIGAILVFMMITLSLFGQSWNSQERAKITGTTIFSMTNEKQWQAIYQYRSQNVISKLYFNKYVYWGRTITENYWQTFSPQFLFSQGGTHPHYNVPGYGNFFILEVFLALVGVVGIIKTRNRLGFTILLILMLAPLPAAITKDGVHSTREIFMLPTVQVLAGYGLVVFLNLRRLRQYKTRFLLMGILLLGVQAVPFYRYYWGQYQIDSDERFTGYLKNVVIDLQTYSDNYEQIYVTFPFESPYIFYAFYNQVDPQDFIEGIKYYPRDNLGFIHAKRLGTMIFPKNTKDLVSLDSDQLEQALVLSRVEEVSNAIEPVQTWNNLDNNPKIVAFEGSQLVSH